jgi:hypothetical protein
MWNTAINSVERWANSLNSQQWFMVLCAVLVMGALCLRGFGSRKNY